ncbi:MAG: hypothetical protein RLZZ77_1196 [Bacteroidota bacterium]|jgi:leucyl aminopeptidase
MAIQALKGNIKTTVSVVLFQPKQIKSLGLSKEVSAHVQASVDKSSDFIEVKQLDEVIFYIPVKETPNDSALEALRAKGNQVQQVMNKMKKSKLIITNESGYKQVSLAIAEGASLGNYQFLKYFSDAKTRKNALEEIYIRDNQTSDAEIIELHHLVEATCLSRTLINEPVSYLTATQFGKEMEKAGKTYGFKVNVLQKKQIEALKMGGLLGVNRGSMDPPTFTVMEYKPKNAKNKKPIVLVGKGVVFDTGGLSLKPTPGSMDEMKCDMSGGAAVVGAISAIAANKLPVYVVGLVPATDNRPGMNAVVPQDVITYSNGKTVEVLNTDAEGRLILADALIYAQKYSPDLVIDLATLTGAAVRAIGSYASAIMGTADTSTMQALSNSGMQVWERTVEFPMWNDYGDEIKSDVADIKNLGSGNAGQITAAKFLEHFVTYPWIHIDIAGPAYLNAPSAYRTKGGTGVGVRLLYNFIKQRYAK